MLRAGRDSCVRVRGSVSDATPRSLYDSLPGSLDVLAEQRAHPADVEASIIARDRKDSTRRHSPLTETDDAIVVDTTGMTIDEVVEHILDLLPSGSR